MEIVIQPLAYYQAIARQNRLNRVPMRLLTHMMPHRRGDIAGYSADVARNLHASGDAVPYFAEGAVQPELVQTDLRPTRAGEVSAEIARLDAIEDLTAAILAEDKLAQIAMGKRIRGLEPKAKMTLEEAVAAITGELERRERASTGGDPTPGVVSTASASSTLSQQPVRA